MVLPRHLARVLRAFAFAAPAILALLYPPTISMAGKKGGTPPPPKKAAEPDPDDKRAKERAAAEKEKVDRKRKGTIATSPQGVLGAAPTSKPELKGTLG